MRRFLPLLLVLCAACGEDDVGASSAGDVTDSLRTRPNPIVEPETGSPDAAVAVIHDYYEAIGEHDYERAYGHWSGEGEASGQTFDAFRTGFAETATVAVETGPPGRLEPAAGSRYITVPVSVRASTTDGEEQCFRGTYTLRRSEVDGATDEQRRWHIASADLAPREVDACAPGRAIDLAVRDSIIDLVTRFGARLASVSLLSPPEVLLDLLREQYGPLVTPELLDEWLGQPSAAPGREVSSPWPDRIEVDAVTHVSGDRYRVIGELVYVTSTEVTSGGAADRQPVQLEVIRGAGGEWRIADYLRRR